MSGYVSQMIVEEAMLGIIQTSTVAKDRSEQKLRAGSGSGLGFQVAGSRCALWQATIPLRHLGCSVKEQATQPLYVMILAGYIAAEILTYQRYSGFEGGMES